MEEEEEDDEDEDEEMKSEEILLDIIWMNGSEVSGESL